MYCIKNKISWGVKSVLFTLLLFASIKCFGTIWTITSTASTFVPSAITITLADSVDFVIASAHMVVEVSQATWNANDTTALAGGFQTAFGGGLIDSSQLQEGTHYYVCKPHAAGGMKGVITVQHHAGVFENSFPGNVSIHPNPVVDILNVVVSGTANESCTARLTDIAGKEIYSDNFRLNSGKNNISIPINSRSFDKGIYFVSLHCYSGVATRQIIIQ